MTLKLGVLGGMGPLATVDFLQKLIAATPAIVDQEHIPTVVYFAAQIPDRTANILGQGPSPLLIEGTRLLERSGATCIAIACNTAHYWYPELSAAANIPILHIAEAACDHAAETITEGSGVGILATAGTLKARVYHDRVERRGYRCVTPHEWELNKLIMPAIYQVKSGQRASAHQLLKRATDLLMHRGAERVIMACTEIPVALERIGSKDVLIDATEALASKCVDWWLQHRADRGGETS